MKIVLFILAFAISGIINAQLNWVSLEEADQLQKENPEKDIFFAFYTKWCGFCRKMDAKTFKNKKVIETLNNNFILVRFDAESKDKLTFRNKTYRFLKPEQGRGVNSFAYFALKGNMAYPSTMILGNPKRKKLVSGYLKPKEMLALVDDLIKKKS